MNAPRADRLAARIAPGLPASVAERLLASPRLGARTAALALRVIEGAGPGIAALPPAEATLAGCDAAALERAAVLAGAVWQAGRIRSLLRGADVAALEEALGPEARQVALVHGSLASSEPGPEMGGLPLAEAVRADGAALLLAWREALPLPVAEALRLTWPLDEPDLPGEEDARRAAGPRIVAQIAAQATSGPSALAGVGG
ncbi:hypothetical protein [Roseomonas sp. WA12]